MFVVYCEVCDRRSVVGVDQVEWVQTLAPGMISVSGHCPHGHDVVVLTGRSFTSFEKLHHWPPAQPVRHPRRHGLGAWLRRHFEVDRALPGLFYRF